MRIYKIVSEFINGIEKKFVMIDMEEYNVFMNNNKINNYDLIINLEWVRKKQQQIEKSEDVERRRIEEIEEKEKRQKEREEQKKQKEEQQIRITKFNNEKLQREKEQLKEDYKEVFKANPEASVKRCFFCNTYRIFPNHFKDENNKSYIIPYTKDKHKEKASCCIDCFETYESKKEERKLKYTNYCACCDKNIIAYTEIIYINHLNSVQHKRNEANLKGKIDLSLFHFI